MTGDFETELQLSRRPARCVFSALRPAACAPVTSPTLRWEPAHTVPRPCALSALLALPDAQPAADNRPVRRDPCRLIGWLRQHLLRGRRSRRASGKRQKPGREGKQPLEAPHLKTLMPVCGLVGATATHTHTRTRTLTNKGRG